MFVTNCRMISARIRLLLDTSVDQDNISETKTLVSLPGKPPKLPADRKPGPAFHVLDEQQASLQKMMASMKVSSSSPHMRLKCFYRQDWPVPLCFAALPRVLASMQIESNIKTNILALAYMWYTSCRKIEIKDQA